jgi:hypothetical protein
MSAESVEQRQSGHELVQQTAAAIRETLSRRDGRATVVGVGVIYFILYLTGIGHIGIGQWGFRINTVADPLARMTQLRGPFQWEPIALIVSGPIELLVSPANIVLGGALAALVGVNLGVSLVAYRGPSACRFGSGAGVAAGVPGLLSGFACCGPTILLVIGVQASTTILTAFQWLLPATGVMLIATLFWVGTKVNQPTP